MLLQIAIEDVMQHGRTEQPHDSKIKRSRLKLCLSCRKSDWEIADYPVSIRTREPGPAAEGSRFRQKPYWAYTVNWGLVGVGDSPGQALQNLRATFAEVKQERRKTGEPLPRPGTRVPIKFASRECIDAHSALAEDFIHRVLGLEWAWISDESSLWDFSGDETNDALRAKIRDVYGVDVSDIASARLSEILERIESTRHGGLVLPVTKRT